VKKLLTFIVVCRDRHEELVRCLPSLSRQVGAGVVLVDYGSRDVQVAKVGLSLKNVDLMRLDEPGEFSLPCGRNSGAAFARSPYLCFTEADVIFSPGFVGKIEGHLKADRFFISDGSAGLYSTCVVPKEAWSAHRFDEGLHGYGRDDCDFFIRLAGAGLTGARMPNSWFEHYEPDPSLRRRMWGDIDAQLAANDAHLRTKYGVGGEGPVVFYRGALPLIAS
jgi:glycosyltransferase involved in cell wall biosynthesis